MKFVFMTCATASEDWSDSVIELYRKKISMMVPLEFKELKAKKASRDDKEYRLKTDSDLILGEIRKDDFVVLFDERGEMMDSRKFSEKISRILLGGKKRAVFIIGGAYGVDDRVRNAAHLKVSFSKMVFNHLIAQAVALEQIYRGMAILKNLPYHND